MSKPNRVYISVDRAMVSSSLRLVELLLRLFSTGCLTIGGKGGKVVFGFGSDVPENLESSRPWSVY